MASEQNLKRACSFGILERDDSPSKHRGRTNRPTPHSRHWDRAGINSSITTDPFIPWEVESYHHDHTRSDELVPAQVFFSSLVEVRIRRMHLEDYLLRVRRRYVHCGHKSVFITTTSVMHHDKLEKIKASGPWAVGNRRHWCPDRLYLPNDF